jgi:hypothetical protein
MIKGKIGSNKEPERYKAPAYGWDDEGVYMGNYIPTHPSQIVKPQIPTVTKKEIDEHLKLMNEGQAKGFVIGARVERNYNKNNKGTITHVNLSYQTAYNQYSQKVELYKVKWDTVYGNSSSEFNYSADELTLVEEAPPTPHLTLVDKLMNVFEKGVV